MTIYHLISSCQCNAPEVEEGQAARYPLTFQKHRSIAMATRYNHLTHENRYYINKHLRAGVSQTQRSADERHVTRRRSVQLNAFDR